MNWKRIIITFILMFTISFCNTALTNNQDSVRIASSTVKGRSESSQDNSTRIRILSAPEDFAAELPGNSGSIEIQALAPDFLGKDYKAQYLLKGVSGFDRHRADTELANFPMESDLPVRITGIKVGEYYVGIRVPSRGVKDGIRTIEDLAWDGAQYECYQTNGYASQMYIVRWYKTKVKTNKISLAVALFFPRSGDRNLKLYESLPTMTNYLVPPNVLDEDEMYDISRKQWLEVLSKAGKLFFGETNDPNEPVGKERMETILYLTDIESKQLTLLGRNLDEECVPHRKALTDFSMSGSKELRKDVFQIYIKNDAGELENRIVFVRTYGKENTRHLVGANDATDVKSHRIIINKKIVID